MCFKSSQMQISNRNKNAFQTRCMLREKRRIGTVSIRDLLAFGRVIAPGDM